MEGGLRSGVLMIRKRSCQPAWLPRLVRRRPETFCEHTSLKTSLKALLRLEAFLEQVDFIPYKLSGCATTGMTQSPPKLP